MVQNNQTEIKQGRVYKNQDKALKLIYSKFIKPNTITLPINVKEGMVEIHSFTQSYVNYLKKRINLELEAMNLTTRIETAIESHNEHGFYVVRLKLNSDMSRGRIRIKEIWEEVLTT